MGSIRYLILSCACVALTMSVKAAPAPDRTVTFEDIRPILINRCGRCHNPSGSAPMSLVSYEAARPWAKAIRRAVVSREMPPFHATGPIGRYKDDIRLTDGQIASICAWVDQGSRSGPRNPEKSAEALAGEDDLLFESKEIPIKLREGHDQWRSILLSEPLPEDLFVRAEYIQAHSGLNPHHSNIYVVDPADHPEDVKVWDISPVFGPESGLAPMFSFCAPDMERILHLPKGMQIVAENHYTGSGEFTATTSVRVTPYTGIITKEGKGILVDVFEQQEAIFFLGPGESRTLKSTVKAPEEAFISGVHVHMHFRGYSATVSVRGEEVFGIDYRTEWERTYELARPVHVAAGEEIEITAVLDNTVDNPNNPDPRKLIFQGVTAESEMCLFGIKLVPVADMETPMHIVDGRRVVGSEVDPDALDLWKNLSKANAEAPARPASSSGE